MDTQIALLLTIIGAALALFTFEWVAADVVALGVLLALILSGLLPTELAFAGFGSNTFILILGLLVLTAALARTGVVDLTGRAILRQTGDNPTRLLVVVMMAAAGLSAFISNTAATAFFLPAVIGLAHRARLSPSKLLMPLAFASILSSSVTLVSTSTNIVVSGLMTRYGQPPMGMFELAPVGIPVTVVGLIYMAMIGRRLIPERTSGNGLDQTYGIRSFLTEVMILPDAPLVGKTLAESGLGSDLDLTVIRVVRGKYDYMLPQADLELQGGDVLLVEGQREEILKIKDEVGIDIKADVKLADPEIRAEELQLVEAILLPRSPLIGRTLKGVRFRERYGLQVLAINRHGETIRKKISQVKLKMGDILLIQGPYANISVVNEGDHFRVLETVNSGRARPNRRRARRAIAIFVGALAAATFNIMSLPVAVLVGTLLVFLTRCITPEEAYRDVEWRVLILIGAMLALGAAMEETGTAQFLAAQIVNLSGNANPLVLLSGFFILTVLLTQPMSNQAAAIVILPVAMQTALRLDLNPRTFAMMIAVAASCSYLTPLEPSCLMVYGPGRYKFVDFLRVGSLLTVLIFMIALALVPLVWPV